MWTPAPAKRGDGAHRLHLASPRASPPGSPPLASPRRCLSIKPCLALSHALCSSISPKSPSPPSLPLHHLPSQSPTPSSDLGATPLLPQFRKFAQLGFGFHGQLVLSKLVQIVLVCLFWVRLVEGFCLGFWVGEFGEIVRGFSQCLHMIWNGDLFDYSLGAA